VDVRNSQPSSQWFDERLSFDDRREVRNPDECVLEYAAMLDNFAEHIRANPLDKTDREHQGFMLWMAGELHDMVKVTNASNYICRYSGGESVLRGREYRDNLMYDTIPLPKGVYLHFDDAIRTYVSNRYPEDVMPGFADSNQLFFVDNQKNIALSANQTVSSLLTPGGGSIIPCLRSEVER
jgi:hypothetical protein